MSAEAVESYLKRPYHLQVVRSESDDGDGGWVVEVEELPGCIAQGRTSEELTGNVRRAMTAWIDDTLDAGDPIPAPR